MLFRRKPLVSDDMQKWIDDNFDWVSENRPDWHEIAALITPTRTFFQAPRGTPHETAIAVVDDIKRLLGITRHIGVAPLPDLPDELSHQYGVLSATGGQYWHDDHNPMITYDPKLLRQPIAFINAMAHELIHARLSDVVDELPGGAEAHELATDLHCIIAGFGLFQLEAAEMMGWAGYMSQASRASALAAFLAHQGIEADAAFAHLSSRPVKLLKRAMVDRSE